MTSKPRVLFLDIETSPIIAYVWGLWENNVALNQIKKDWHVLSWAAKWAGDPPDKVMYRDQRKSRRIEDDKATLKPLWKLLNQADIIVTQNGKAFDQKKLNARFILNGFQPPMTPKHIDTKELAKKKFAFTSNRLEYLTDKLCTKYKKLKHPKYAGQDLWTECLKGNLDAWNEMETYNKHDVLALEELYEKLRSWDTGVNFSIYNKNTDHVCQCGGKQFKKQGFAYTAKGKFQRYRCKGCGAESRSTNNLFTKAKRKSLRAGVN